MRLKGRAAELAATVLSEWRERGLSDDIHEVDRPISDDELARFFDAPYAQALVGRPVAEIVAAVRSCGTEWDQARAAERIIASEPNRIVEILRAMRACGLAEVSAYSGVFWGLRSLAESEDSTAHLLRPIAGALAADHAPAALCLDGAEDWLRSIHAQSTQKGPYALDFWWVWGLLAAVNRDFVAPEQDDEEPYNTALNAAGGSLADVLIEDEGRLGGPGLPPVS